MQKKIPFIHKLLNKLDRLDRESIQSYVRNLAGNKNLYEEIFQNLDEGVIIVNPEGRVRFQNRQASLWFADSASAWESFSIADRIDDSAILQFIIKNLPSLSERKVADFKLLSPREISLRIALVPLENSPDQEALILMTQIPGGRETLLEDEGLSRIGSLIRLTSGIAHEIGNPLNSVGIHLQLLKKQLKEFPEAKRKDFEKTVDVISAETDRLDHIIKGFLKATRKPPLRFKLEDLNAIVEEAIQFMSPELKKNGLSVSFRGDPNLPAFLLDKERLYQAFINLIKNSMEATPAGGTLKISLAHRGKMAVLIFKDNGTGIHDADLPHIFEPYYTTKKEGFGLGLMTVFDSVSEHGGRIEVASKAGKGTAFTLLLPIRQPKLQLPQYQP